MMKVMRTPTTAYDIKEWMWGMEEDAPKGEVRGGDVVNCRPEQKMLVLSVLVKVVSRWCRRQGRSQFTRDTSNGSPLLGMGVLTGEAIEVPSIQLKQEHQEKATHQHAQEGVLG